MTGTGDERGSHAAADSLVALLESGVVDGVFPGAVAAVGSSDGLECVVTAGSRDPERDLATTRDTVFDLASLTKPVVTTTVALALAEHGTIALSDTLDRYLPELDGTARGEIQLVDLLTHTSGLQPYEFDTAWTTSEETLSGLFERSLREAAPGEQFAYSCLNYVHLAAALRAATDETFESLAQRHVFGPAGMETACLGPTDAEPVAATYDHEYRDRTLRGEIHDPLGNAMDGESGNAGLFGTVDDVAAFASHLLSDRLSDDARTDDRPRLLSSATVERLSRNHIPNLEERRSLGWRLAHGQTPGVTWPEDTIGHTGYTGTSLWLDPVSDRFAVLLTNQVYIGKETGLERFRERFHNLVGSGQF